MPSLLPSVRTLSLGVSAETSGRRVLEPALWVELDELDVLFRVVEVASVELELDEASADEDEDEDEGAAEDDEAADDEDDGAAVELLVDGAADEEALGDGASDGDGAAEELGSGVHVLVGASELGSGVQVLVGSGVHVDVGSSFLLLGLGSSQVELSSCCWLDCSLPPLLPPSPPDEPPPLPSFHVHDIWKRPTSLWLNFSKSAGLMSSDPCAHPGQRSTTVALALLPPSVIVRLLPQCAPPSHWGALSATTISLSELRSALLLLLSLVLRHMGAT